VCPETQVEIAGNIDISRRQKLLIEVPAVFCWQQQTKA
jgi:hypothetical protein